MLNLRLANLAKDQSILNNARNDVMHLLATDPHLTQNENMPLRIALEARAANKSNWSKIS
jgi:ATP-dependent DNA helicase RecG